MSVVTKPNRRPRRCTIPPTSGIPHIRRMAFEAFRLPSKV